MPMAKSLGKVQKALKSSRGAVHPKGRKFKMLNRATLREKKLQDAKVKHAEKRGGENLIYSFFQQAILTPQYQKDSFSVDEIRTFIEAFITRDDEELEALREDRRPGRPPTARQQHLEERIRKEQHLFETGWPVPDLQDAESVKHLKNWNGSPGGLTIIKKIIVKESA
ncbi:unnamed protein product [Kuraishia capsulata CBS 1993]|uniref:Translation machinery-associated protein 16 n=1 Tax=Kuraishia capsulata CBS 1993 TaxID=1382522 RepID=W6MP23_9ASCO|nr:uncharacterized protein KUCA_T00004406001 [Kuraishia capsulata CBS 1993]CDK28424.1 unnamed protein product [Kuraishia capsulata CBS 1993]